MEQKTYIVEGRQFRTEADYRRAVPDRELIERLRREAAGHDKKKLEQFLSSPSDYGRPWYGQLMAAPQMLAYLLQINFWLETYSLHCVSLS